MATHELKCWPEPFAALERGEKHHEVRKADRDYLVGDALGLREFQPCAPGCRLPYCRKDGGIYTGRMLLLRITYITQPGTFGLPADLCVMSLEPVAWDGGG